MLETTNISWISADEILFRWTPEKKQLLREFWEDYALVLETLEENQVRIFCFGSDSQTLLAMFRIENYHIMHRQLLFIWMNEKLSAILL